jgi:streptogramin lyase
MLAKKAGVLFIISLMILFLGQASAAEKVYTFDADFDEGDKVNVNHDSPNNDQLQLDTITPVVFVAASGRGTVVRIDADFRMDNEIEDVMGESVMGEYRSAPEGAVGGSTPNPSRTSTDSLGNVWVANRDVAGGSVVKIGIVIGGTRVSINDIGETIEDDEGGYLQGPFDYSTCVDRDGDDLIRTSRRLSDILPWTGDGADGAEDECILIYQQLDFVGSSNHVSVDADNNVWVGQYPPGMFYKLDGDTGTELASFDAGTFGCGGWGGLVDGDGILWSASPGENSLLHYDPADGSGGCIEYDTGTIPWGLGLDSEGFIWNGLRDSDEIAKVDPTDFSIVDGFPKTPDSGDSADPPFFAPQGVAVTPVDNNVWVASSGGSDVYRLDDNGEYLSIIGVGRTPTGVAVDANGNVWVTNLTDNNVMRIDPNDGGGDVALTVPLGDSADPVNYSNMTGVVPLTEAGLEGTWTVVYDSGDVANSWETITWNNEPEASVPQGSSITVEARAAETETGLADEEYLEISNNVPFSLTGQFIEIRATLRANDDGASPILSDLVVYPKSLPQREVCDVDENGIIDYRDIKEIFRSFGDTADGPDDPRDWDRDEMITKIDARGCIRECTNRYCAPSEIEEPCLEKDRYSKKHRRSKRPWRSKRHWKSANCCHDD